MTKRYKPIRLGISFALAVAGVAITIAAVTVLPELVFLTGTPIIDVAADPEGAKSLGEAARDIRLTLTEQYFNWSILTIGICVGIYLRFQPKSADNFVRLLIVTAFLLSAASIVVGSSYLELAEIAFGQGLEINRLDTVLRGYPKVQYLLVIGGFMFSVLAALVSILKQPDEG